MNPKQVYKDIKKTHYSPELENQSCKGLKKYVTVRDAIEELPKLLPGGGDKEIYFVSKKNNEFLKQITDNEKNVLYDHVCRNHNFKDIERYKQMSENNWTFSELLKNRPDLSHSKRRVFGNSYVVQWWDYPSKTIIAHLYKDGNQFIHPDSKQGRTLTVREVARLQSFPDNFIFMGSRTQQYKQIGNAVPPLLAQAIAKSVKKHLKEVK
nr:DNA cytosine methyltransferase [Thomasclavelia cocleata]